MNNSDRREYRRYPIKVIKILKYAQNQETFKIEGFIENISLGGCNFISTNAIPDDINEVFFDIRYSDKNMPLILEVVRRRRVEFFKKDCNEYGLKFKEELNMDMIKNMKFV